jgi:alpha/beta superfamily hydrolase
VVNGEIDKVAPAADVQVMVDKLKAQKGINIEHVVVPNANHFFENRIDELMAVVDGYLNRVLLEE